MDLVGKRLRTAKRRDTLRVTGKIGKGGEGIVFSAHNEGNGKDVVLKAFLPPEEKQYRVHRAAFLTELDLPHKCSAIAGPVDFIDNQACAMVVSPLAPGNDLGFFQERTALPLMLRIQAGVAIAHALSCLHNAGIAHADVHLGNIFLKPVDDQVAMVTIIDIDGFAAPGYPAKTYGALNYLAPEQFRLYQNGKPSLANPAADVFSLSVLFHEFFLRVSPSSTGRLDDDVLETLYCGRWAHDPVNPRAVRGEGLPATLLDPTIQSLFRRGVSLDPAERPTAADWKGALLSAMEKVWRCPRCSFDAIISDGLLTCPCCGQAYPLLGLAVQHGRVIPFERGVTEIGRNKVMGLPQVSTTHAVVRRRGPEFWLESRGRNGTFRFAQDAGNWIRLPDGREVLLRPGDRLRIGPAEVRVVVVQ